jgi:flavin reductase (DIM6/NTAB) family NADH-FMN oxidoreductase RutF
MNIRQNSEFVVNLVERSVLQQMNVTAIEFTKEVDELVEVRLTSTSPTRVIKPPLRIGESPANNDLTQSREN